MPGSFGAFVRRPSSTAEDGQADQSFGLGGVITACAPSTTSLMRSSDSNRTELIPSSRGGRRDASRHENPSDLPCAISSQLDPVLEAVQKCKSAPAMCGTGISVIMSAVSLGHDESLIVQVGPTGRGGWEHYPEHFRRFGHLRLSVGLADADDLLADLRQAVDAVMPAGGRVNKSRCRGCDPKVDPVVQPGSR